MGVLWQNTNTFSEFLWLSSYWLGMCWSPGRQYVMKKNVCFYFLSYFLWMCQKVLWIWVFLSQVPEFKAKWPGLFIHGVYDYGTDLCTWKMKNTGFQFLSDTRCQQLSKCGPERKSVNNHSVAGLGFLEAGRGRGNHEWPTFSFWDVCNKINEQRNSILR